MGREEGEDPGKDGKRKWKEIFKCWESEDGESWWQIGNKKWKDIVGQAKGGGLGGSNPHPRNSEGHPKIVPNSTRL